MDQPPLASSGDVPGSKPSQMTRIVCRNTPEANSGTEVVTMLATEMARSVYEPSRMPASTPRMIEVGTMMAKASEAMIRVCSRRSQMMSLTGTPHRVDLPRSPCRICHSHST